MTIALVFPGQGSQAVGMGGAMTDAFAVARETMEEVDDALGQNLSRLIRLGPDDELLLTENAQPALMAVSIAAMRVLTVEAGLDPAERVALVAGHSLGEYSALAAAAALGLSDTARLLKARGRAMQEAVPIGTGAMVALIGAELDQAREIAAEAAQDEVCDTANDNAPGQIVLSGDVAAIDRAIELAEEKGIKRSIKLPVSAPFHCRLMQPAAEVMRDSLAEVALAPPEPGGGRQCLGRGGHRPGRDPRASGRPGHRDGALAGMRACNARRRCYHHYRDRCRQGADRADQADRSGAHRDVHRGSPTTSRN